MSLLLIIAAAGGCAVVSGVLGMGGGMILMGVLAALLPVEAAMVLHGVIQLAANGSRAALLARSIEWRVVARFCVGALAALAVFAWLQIAVDKATLFLLLGGLPLAFAVAPRLPRLDVTHRPTAVVAGTLVTSIQLVAGVSGPVLDIFFLRAHLGRYQVVATKAALSMLGHILKLFYFGILLASADLAFPGWLYPAVIASAIAGTRIGKQLLGHLSEDQFRRYCRWLIVSIAAVYCARGLYALA